MKLFQHLFSGRVTRRDAELAYLKESVTRYDLERREREIAAGKFSGY